MTLPYKPLLFCLLLLPTNLLAQDTAKNHAFEVRGRILSVATVKPTLDESSLFRWLRGKVLGFEHPGVLELEVESIEPASDVDEEVARRVTAHIRKTGKLIVAIATRNEAAGGNTTPEIRGHFERVRTRLAADRTLEYHVEGRLEVWLDGDGDQPDVSKMILWPKKLFEQMLKIWEYVYCC